MKARLCVSRRVEDRESETKFQQNKTNKQEGYLTHLELRVSHACLAKFEIVWWADNDVLAEGLLHLGECSGAIFGSVEIKSNMSGGASQVVSRIRTK